MRYWDKISRAAFRADDRHRPDITGTGRIRPLQATPSDSQNGRAICATSAARGRAEDRSRLTTHQPPTRDGYIDALTAV